ncbi:MAG TPA: sterol desaturase family protein, partial [Polyangiaceae bacterium]
MELVAYAVPAFIVFALLEALIGRLLGRKLYRHNDFVSALGCGALDQIVNASAIVVFLGAYAWLGSHFGLSPASRRNVAGWVLAFLGYDLCYYAFHRACHRVNFLWATHIVHHQSDEYNLGVSLRQGAIATWVTYVFYLPLALVGVPIEVFLVVHGAYQLYQFFVHTRLVKSLGPLEWIFATPSLHRVHHGRTPDCLDKNYGGFLNVWDRLFGSYARERREPAFGITTGIRAWSPFWANVHHFTELFHASRTAPTLGGAVKVWLAPPEWKAPWLPEPPYHERYDERPWPAFTPYVFLQLAFALAGGWLLLVRGGTLADWVRYVFSGLVLMTLFSVGAFFDRKPWAPVLEGVRTFVIAGVFTALVALGVVSAAVGAAVTLTTLVS